MYRVDDMDRSIYDAFYDKFLVHIEISKNTIFTIFKFSVVARTRSKKILSSTRVQQFYRHKTSSRRRIILRLKNRASARGSVDFI